MENWKDFCSKFQYWSNSLLIGSLSFEKRCLNALKILENYPKVLENLDFEFFKVLQHLGKDCDLMDSLLEENRKDYETITIKNKLTLNFNDFKIYDEHKNIIGPDMIIQSLKNQDHLKHKNVFLDISSFPRSVFFPLIKFLYKNESISNLFILWTEKKGLRNEKNVLNYSQINKIPLFPKLPNRTDIPFFWLPILGYDRVPIQKIIGEGYFGRYDYKVFYPIVAFPSRWPEETDDIIMEHMDFFKENLSNDTSEHFELSNIKHVPSNNPFELFLMINKFKENKEKIFEDSIIALSPFGTKAQSLGACLASIILDLPILYYNPEFYKLSEKEKNKKIEYKELVGKTYVAWIKGEIYN